MGIDEKITCEYAARNLADDLETMRPKASISEEARYLHTRIVSSLISGAIEGIEGVHSLYLLCTDPKRFNRKIEGIEKDKEMERQLRSVVENEYAQIGINTRNERDAYEVTSSVGSMLGRLVQGGHNKYPVGIVYAEKCGKRVRAEEVIVTKQVFETYLQKSVECGIAHTFAFDKEEALNSGFKEKAVDWLRSEVYSRISDGNECELLNSVRVSEDGGRIRLKILE